MSSTFAPFSASAAAIFTEVVVLPSLAPVEVTTMSRQFVSSMGAMNDRFVRTRRKPSATGLPGSLTITGFALFSNSSSGMRPMIGASIYSLISSSSWIRLDSTSLSNAANTPRINPPTMPTRMLSFHFGELGELGTAAGWTTDNLTDECEPEAYSVVSTTELSDFAMAFAISAAWAGSPSVTEMLTNAVFVGLVTLTCSLSCATVVCNPRSSITGYSTDCVVVSTGYDLIWLMIYELPLFCSDEFAVPSDESLYVANN